MTMKANELRIGNWVSYIGNKACVVTRVGYEPSGIYISAKNNATVFYNVSDAFNPIPLTPEILEKAGFEKGSYKSMFYPIGAFNLVVSADWAMYNGVKFTCQYLHQLQNLVYCLTGEELNIQL